MTIALVTGSTRGIGLATARRLAADCVHVYVTGRDEAAGRAAARQIREAGYEASYLPLDVTDRASIAAAVDVVARAHGRLDILVNNAGILPEAAATEPAEAVSHRMFEATFATNVLGPVAVLEGFLPLLRKSTAGRIVNISSTMASLADQSDPASPYYPMVMPAYQASKAALNSVTIGLAKLLADTPVKVTAVCPGFVRTGLAPQAQDAPLSPEEAAEVVTRAALLPDDAPSGTFVDAAGPVRW
jgi:NAD(P)-dependent dehydrogenase (short-subunit alcohol dehydrogenase family)